ncbi:conserved hypothetical protein [Treponema primitia ZAS-2]|uniref:Uncharacterized protein n=1 Tax=Treponema primitia (strain ATCC BAA-887 / DSM 12427 / ZAS-2) TaxID=545694 RepID=F5YL87_TREPZ|nr:hypothetical protein [Treponema primitia]AEF86835.1 conserved hypothetical protein [Treponema primitia ZAS-2]
MVTCNPVPPIKTIDNPPDLSTRSGFNAGVRHIKKTLAILDALDAGEQLADILPVTGGEPWQTQAILRTLLIDKRGYQAVSANLNEARDLQSLAPALAGEFAKWQAVELTAVYHHPELGPLVVNPKKEEPLAALGVLAKHELLVIYAGSPGAGSDAAGSVPGLAGTEATGAEPGGEDFLLNAAKTALALFQGSLPEIAPALYQGPAKKAGARSPKRAPAVKGGGSGNRSPKRLPVETTASLLPQKTLSPRYIVTVTNDLFHNGNVEAWKRIIASYRAAYPELEVYLYYEDERILDINSLFQWGKVKHGGGINFAVAGKGIKDVAKLRRYLAEGASPRFEPFLRGSPGTLLKLFGPGADL